MFKKYKILLTIILFADSFILYSSDKETITTVYDPIAIRRNYAGDMSLVDTRTGGLVAEEYKGLDSFEGFVPSLILRKKRKLLIEQRSKEGEILIARQENNIQIVFPEGTQAKTVRRLVNKIATIPKDMTLVLLPY